MNLFPFHNVEKSPWPLLVSFSVLGMLLNLVLYSHQIVSFNFFFFFLLLLCLKSYLWWKEVLNESNFGYHNIFVVKKFYMGMLILIISEVFFFVSFFWAFFHKCWFPSMEFGNIWPPVGYTNIMVDPFSIPLLNTIILLSSGVTVTWAHHSLLFKDKVSFKRGLFFTILLGIMFLYLQNFEYSNSFFSFNSSVYGSCFYLLTGFHGGHVIVGTIFLLVCYIRSMYSSFIAFQHMGLELAMWYWHFVDVVWLFLFIFVYWYKSL